MTRSVRIAFVLVLALSIAGLTACGGGGGDDVSPSLPPTEPTVPVEPSEPPTEPTEPTEPVEPPTGLSLPLPPGHDLSAGQFTVQPGSSAEHGNVMVSCPAGGSACVVAVAADGTASYDQTGGVPTVMAAYGPWTLPANHGLVAGRFTVQPGSSAEHGNVVVSCPAGGSACVVAVAADGTASYDQTGGMPTVMAAYGPWTLPANHGLVAGQFTIQPGTSAEHGNVMVSCPAGGSACVVAVAADGTASYDQTGGVPTVMAAYGPWELPANHGLVAGQFTIQPGTSAEHGNVMVSCPAGGSACVVAVAADGTASYDRTGGVPSIMAAYGPWELPSGHGSCGLAAGQFTIQPGSSAEHGNVVVSCPAGGSACIVAVAADGTATYDQTGGVPTVMAAYGPWELPANHGLVAGQFTIQPGSSAEHGNVMVSCPAGGSACVVAVAADGTASYDQTGGVPTVMAAYGPWTLPANHGLVAGRFTVQPGSSAEHGNVVVSCPAGGSACVVAVAADGTASYDQTGGMPTVMAAYGPWTLPANHGLVAGQFTIQPGSSAEHGNVMVSCPAGGSACVVAVAADGTASYDQTGGMPTVMAAYGPWTLPANHGLVAGQFTIQPGTSAEHGNVVVSCPAGGSACVVDVAADGTATYARTGGVPAIKTWSYSRNNPTAEDLLDHWNEPETLRSALGLSAVSQSAIAERKSSLNALLNSAGGDLNNAGVRFRNVRAEDVQIIGEKNGITYGQWKGGPAGTLNIEFDWRFATDINPAAHAWMERAGKMWSWHLKDNFGKRVARQGTEIRYGVNPDGSEVIVSTLTEDIPVDDILFIMQQHHGLDGGGANPHRFRNGMNDYEPWLGSMILGPEQSYQLLVPGGQIYRNWFRVMTHEIGHVLGFSGVSSDGHILAIERHTNRQAHNFEGPEAVKANGGEPVPFQWLDNERRVVPPHTPGATVDYGHPGGCSSVMTYCFERSYPPTELDFAILSDIGFEVLDATTARKPEAYGWGAWGRYSGWGAGVERTIRYEDGEDGFVSVHDQFRAGADAFGMAPTTSLADNRGLMGTATWSGSLLGVDLGQDMLPPVFGDAELQVELSSLDGTARFNGLTVFVENAPSPFRAPDLEYVIQVNGNSFSDVNGRIDGAFYGPAHEEMAGVLDDRSPDVNLLAGFGGKR